MRTSLHSEVEGCPPIVWNWTAGFASRDLFCFPLIPCNDAARMGAIPDYRYGLFPFIFRMDIDGCLVLLLGILTIGACSFHHEFVLPNDEIP